MIAVNPFSLGGGQESPMAMQNFIDQTGITFTAGWDLGRSYSEFETLGGISPFPLDVVIDRDGIVRYVKPEYDAAAMDAVLQELFPE